jgi:hypothetical protein
MNRQDRGASYSTRSASELIADRATAWQDPHASDADSAQTSQLSVVRFMNQLHPHEMVNEDTQLSGVVLLAGHVPDAGWCRLDRQAARCSSPQQPENLPLRQRWRQREVTKRDIRGVGDIVWIGVERGKHPIWEMPPIGLMPVSASGSPATGRWSERAMPLRPWDGR